MWELFSKVLFFLLTLVVRARTPRSQRSNGVVGNANTTYVFPIVILFISGNHGHSQADFWIFSVWIASPIPRSFVEPVVADTVSFITKALRLRWYVYSLRIFL
ncbi:uncharacterized protein F4812DRAFT_354753 [Daldinia caldariorum]|uniref:uncharacterized protein n=1 Tax=Daldinia caldariorum TaxID=326644 RepID=UPI002008183B|nr:uncharacterized protein F4812DRAFT_354753 [Daldinia caldariorum]KAI1469026.1 hypothetical protein F4812DRAFT_354753 [Daldinia caldariorum]